MSAQKFQFQLAFLLLTICLLSSQLLAKPIGKCHYKGPCETDNDCKTLCTGPDEDPTFLMCIKNPPINHKCCCVPPIN
ncbi:unnamed protein product [Arabidopsis lyrata]|uniref:Uncharacterized protein n=3 Tax=Arabidopsis TaxID=3701 RepID=D7MCJ5_ARALL|nr:hypothetical protein ARALYDRAFT_913533 [Arabidopsis lyrata subsp. lyrata]KAG7540999.1 hypothetical protein ISN45_Aa07g011390 [Arabidopsis thaliana x Arabidopsis arenosa]KAG7545705.1 hypothetical protein ISN44_As12g011450 [Arabidopsis suecica]CAH8274911.1 unnamed protein product [Arabidopsis lyrata]